MLEELKDIYGIEWGTTVIDIRTNKQKEDWFLKLDPNGTSPVLGILNYRLTSHAIQVASQS